MLFIRLILLFAIALSASARAASDETVIWVDVRSEAEYEEGHIEGHPNIPYETIAARITELTDDKDAPIRLYCRSGRRSGVAQETLQEQGYTNVENVGGYEEVKANLETVTVPAPPTVDMAR